MKICCKNVAAVALFVVALQYKDTPSLSTTTKESLMTTMRATAIFSHAFTLTNICRSIRSCTTTHSQNVLLNRSPLGSNIGRSTNTDNVACSCHRVLQLQASKQEQQQEHEEWVQDQIQMQMRPIQGEEAGASAKGGDIIHNFEKENDFMCNDVIAYPQQTPHSGRHFLPFHPYYYPHRDNDNCEKRLIPRRRRRRRRRKKSLLLSSSSQSNSIKRKRFMEGWYYKVTLPEHNTSIAFMYSIEIENQKQPEQEQQPSLTAIQVMGPNDEYLVQASTDIKLFWAYENCQAFGCTFQTKDGMNENKESASRFKSKPAIHPNLFMDQTQSGYQVLPTKMQGKLIGHDGLSQSGNVLDFEGVSNGTCEFDITIDPMSGWGDNFDNNDVNDNDYEGHRTVRRWQPLRGRGRIRDRRKKPINWKQKSTAGWLASYSIFEPHWQITIADAKATGYVNWNGTKYEFTNAPFYSEKNWGSSFPTKWYWIQCNSFIGYGDGDGDDDSDNGGNGGSRLALTAGGGIRNLSFFGLKKSEDLGMVGIHYNGTFYENVPWTGEMQWDIDTWGRWNFNGRCTTGKRLFEVVVQARCDLDAGVMLRVPTKEFGLSYMCRDTFEGQVSLSLYELEYCKDCGDYVRRRDVSPIIENAISNNCAVEVGGGPWDETWKSKSKMNRILKFLVKIPYLIS